MKVITCPFCGQELEKDGRCYNIDCTNYDPASQYFDDWDLDLELALQVLEDNEQYENKNCDLISRLT